MTKAYLFDWGDTLMVDFKNKHGPMMDWDYVEEVEGATQVLALLSQTSKIYVGTGAPEATPESIAGALYRVGLDKYISGYFCPSEIAHNKPDTEFYSTICRTIGLDARDMTMVGDSLYRDILPALKAGMQAIWLNAKGETTLENNVCEIKRLTELCQKHAV